MRRCLSILATAFFLAGGVVFPIAHALLPASAPIDAACSDHCGAAGPDAGHHADDCPVCQIANVPLIASVPVLPAVRVDTLKRQVDRVVRLYLPRTDHRLPFACGPPA